jgi:Fur family ferric uptake transcriptional regulator
MKMTFTFIFISGRTRGSTGETAGANAATGGAPFDQATAGRQAPAVSRARHTSLRIAGSDHRSLKPEVVDRGLERLRTLLRERSLKMSKVRESIARTALSYRGHFSVEELVQVLRENGVSEAHQATVYRALPLMIEAGLIQPAMVSKADGQRYEASFEREHHDHLVCTSCGRVVEYQSEPLEALQREIAERYGFELEDHVHQLLGRCRDCRRVR